MNRQLRRFAIPQTIAALVLVALSCSGGAPANAQKAVAAQAPVSRFKTEIVVRTIRNLRNRADVELLVEMAARHEVGVINLAAKQDEDDEIASGLVFYPSTIAPRSPQHKTFDFLKAMIEAAHARGIKVRAWVPQFHDQVAARKDPDWQMQMSASARTKPYYGGTKKEYFVNPLSAGVQDYQRSIVAEIVRNYNVDGIVLDWLRFDDYNMDMGADTRKRYKEAFGYDPITINLASDNPLRTQWNAWRTAQIARYVESVRKAINEIKPGLDLGVYILPPEFIEVGQDAGQFSQHVNFLSPMVYFDDWGYPISWVHTNVLPQTREKARGVTVVPVMDTDWSDAAYGEIMTHMRKEFPEISTLSWFVYGVWTEETFKRINMLRSL
ncbi:MAG: family 10 glycosylhydrolase [Reyranella sp.]|nr:family 10 glycosylhydrolase [Reyranella sp.]